MAGFRDSGDSRVIVADAAEFAAVVGRSLPALSLFPEGTDVPVDSWSDRVEQMQQVLTRVAAAPPKENRQ